MPDNKGQLGDDSAASKEKKEKENSGKKDGKGDRWKEINKEVSKDEREKFKDDLPKKKRRRRRPKRKPEYKPAEKRVEPINPFEEKLPPKDYEKRYEGEKKEDEKDPFKTKKDEVGVSGPEKGTEKETAPINPFETVVKSEEPLEDKALEDRPLEKRDEAYHEEPAKEVEQERDEPEEVKQAEEEVAEEGEGEDNVEEAEVVDVKEVSEEKPEEKREDVVDVGGVPNENVKEEFKGEFWDVLENAGITKRKLVGVGVFIGILIVVGLFFLFGGAGMFDFGGDEDLVVVSDEEVEQTEVNVVSVKGVSAYPLVSAYIFGLEFTREPLNPIEAEPIGKWGQLAGIVSAFTIGEPSEAFRGDIVYYSDVLRRIKNMYNTDVYALLDMSTNRVGVLRAHLDEMAALLEEAREAQRKVVNSMTSLDLEYESVATGRDSYEQAYFDFAEEFYGQNAFESLESFISASQLSSRIKAYYSAYSFFADKFAVYISALEPRYLDISSNEEALIKGVHVFDFTESDIDAIIPVE
ncbi:MAG: hypothetical protein V1679_00790 [Candidatus Peregrinibacteria bacterium]